jgi:hypothetical protein
LVWGLFVLTGKQAGADNVVYATFSSSESFTSTFGTLDLTTGQFDTITNRLVFVGGLTTGANGTLYAGTADGNLYTLSSTGAATQFGTLTAGSIFGLAYAGASGFFGTEGDTPSNLDQISVDGTSANALATLPPIPGLGALSFGPSGSLYFDGTDSSGKTALFLVNTTTGATTEIGSGLGSFQNDPLSLVNVGGQLYGIDGAQPFDQGPINIYTINTTTGVANETGVTVTSAPYALTFGTAAAGAVPEPSSLTLYGIAGVIGLVVARVRSKRTA